MVSPHDLNECMYDLGSNAACMSVTVKALIGSASIDDR